jgi:predicted pyridoxine 5'-phosphate oxidase superfamily flavin-nucleotide-binding protein
MSELYGTTHRAFQDEHRTRGLADRLESMSHSEFDANDREFIGSVSLFFLASVDELGRPTVSYKGGAPGFVAVTAPGELVFPSYDGNGMFLSLGNIASHQEVGLLFIDFSTPRRLRVQGRARVESDAESLARYPGAQHVVRVTATHIFVNCGRYIHRLEDNKLSVHVPDGHGEQPFPAWKRIDVIADSLSAEDRARVEQEGGPLPLQEYRGEL